MEADRFRYYLNMQSLTLQHVMSLWHVPNTILHTAIFIGPSPFTVYTAMFQSHQLLVLYVCFFRKLPNLYSLILQHLSWMIFYLLLFYHYNLFVLYPLVLNKLNLTMLILNSPIVLMPITSHNMYLVHQPCLVRFDPTGSLHYTPWIQYSLQWSCYLMFALSSKVWAFEGKQLWCWQCECGS